MIKVRVEWFDESIDESTNLFDVEEYEFKLRTLGQEEAAYEYIYKTLSAAMSGIMMSSITGLQGGYDDGRKTMCTKGGKKK